MSKRIERLLWVAACLATQIGATAAAEPLKTGFVTTLSGPAGYLGQDIRDAFFSPPMPCITACSSPPPSTPRTSVSIPGGPDGPGERFWQRSRIRAP